MFWWLLLFWASFLLYPSGKKIQSFREKEAEKKGIFCATESKLLLLGDGGGEATLSTIGACASTTCIRFCTLLFLVAACAVSRVYSFGRKGEMNEESTIQQCGCCRLMVVWFAGAFADGRMMWSSSSMEQLFGLFSSRIFYCDLEIGGHEFHGLLNLFLCRFFRI